ncbi:MAG TPA: 3-deoxy-manno-octulosonate cytidylyltransferase [Thermoanaerobaculia bacterium]|nr:3-deoxy-manno-octulosonate cytidylyltransferase [Thermoanaerobaculia bacterium]
MKAVILIPARWASTRFPGKPLVAIAGVSLIRRVYERAAGVERASAVYVATDDDRIADHVSAFGGGVLRPEGDFQTGTDRIAAAVRLLGDEFDQVVNVQGDEPLLDAGAVGRVIETLQREEEVDIATLASPIGNEEEYRSRDVVKVVTDLAGNALYFSRAPIPFGSRDEARRHIGLYGYQTRALLRFAELPQTSLERAESLEQLRALENGLKIRVLHTDKPHLGVDRPEDVLRVESEIAKLR